MDIGCKGKSEFVGKTPYDFYKKEQSDQVTLADKEVLRSGKEYIVEEYGDMIFGENILYLSHKVPLKNKNNEILGVLGASFDITHARQKEIDRKEFLENIIAMMPGHIFWMDRNGVYQGCNDRQAYDIGLRSRKEIIGKRNKDLFDSKELGLIESFDKVNEDVMKSGVPLTIEEPSKSVDGSERRFLSNKVPLRNEHGEIVGLLGIALDVTSLRETEVALQIAKEKAEAADKLKTQFILNIQHDIRTPFNGIYSAAVVLLDQETDAEKKKFLQAIVSSAKVLLDYCNSILDLSQIEQNTSLVTERRFNLHDIVKKAVMMELPAADVKHLQLEMKYASDIPHEFYGDDFRIYRIIINLLSNACKFTTYGSISVEVKLVRVEDNRKAIINIIVKDTGEGIPDDLQKIIFEKFTRGTLSNKGTHKGMGLGLYIVKHFIEELDGDLSLESVVGQGSTFVCTIPLKLPL